MNCMIVIFFFFPLFRTKLSGDTHNISFTYLTKFLEAKKSALIIPYPKSFDFFIFFCRHFELDFDILVEPLGISNDFIFYEPNIELYFELPLSIS